MESGAHPPRRGAAGDERLRRLFHRPGHRTGRNAAHCDGDSQRRPAIEIDGLPGGRRRLPDQAGRSAGAADPRDQAPGRARGAGADDQAAAPRRDERADRDDLSRGEQPPDRGDRLSRHDRRRQGTAAKAAAGPRRVPARCAAGDGRRAVSEEGRGPRGSLYRRHHDDRSLEGGRGRGGRVNGPPGYLERLFQPPPRPAADSRSRSCRSVPPCSPAAPVPA